MSPVLRRMARNILSAAAHAGVCLTASSLMGQSTQVHQLIEQGVAAMREGQPAAAERAFREAVRLAPDVAETYIDLGLVLGREGKLDEATATMRLALQKDPSQNAANLYLGIFLFQANHAGEAKTALQQVVRQSPENAEAWTWLGNVDLAIGKADDAAMDFDHAAALAPDDLNVLEQRGRAHNQVAHDSYARMARLDPSSWHVHRVQAQLYSDEGRHADAIAEYKAAIQQQTKNPDLLEALGDEYRATSQLEAARTAYASELELAPHNPIALYNLGSTDIELGDGVKGIPLLRAMMALYPDSPVAAYYLGRGLALTGQDAEAADWFRKSANADAHGEIGKRSCYELVRIDRKLHRPAEAQLALAAYNRIRAEQEQASAQQTQDWRKMTQHADPQNPTE